ncbi:MAG: hypothetical protein NVSMB14_17930 [Isosphaeraceae bacterium]
MAERQVVHLARLIEDLMDVVRISQGKIVLHRQPVELATIIGRAIETSHHQIDEKGHRFIVSLPHRPILVEGNLTRLEQVLWNLLNNAAKYTEPGGTINLTVETEGKEVVASVKDSGLGIAREMLPKVFDMFVQVGEHVDHAQGGLGIGLSLVKTLLEMHGGTILARSPGPGLGSEFVFRLPITAGAAEKREGKKTPELEGRITPPRRKILLVDDNKDAAASLAKLVRRVYHQEVRMEHDGPEAILAVGEFHPELILLDIGLPSLSGYEVAEILRRKTENRNILIAAVTGWGQEEDRRRSFESGIDVHFVKPVNPDALVDLLRDDRFPRQS